MKNEIIQKLNALEDFLNNKCDLSIEDYQEVIKYTFGIRSDVLNMIEVVPQREKLIAFLINLDECYGMNERKKAEKCVNEYLSNLPSECIKGWDTPYYCNELGNCKKC